MSGCRNWSIELEIWNLSPVWMVTELAFRSQPQFRGAAFLPAPVPSGVDRPLVYALRFGIHFSVNLVTFSYCGPISYTVYVWEPTWNVRTIRQAHHDFLSYLSLNLDPKKAVATSERSSTCSRTTGARLWPGCWLGCCRDVGEAATGTAARLQPRQRCHA
jgi:hypothetical protein